MTEELKKKIDEFKQDQHEALLSLDRDRIATFMQKYDIPIPLNEEVFWGSVHKARTALPNLGLEARKLSKAWLNLRNWESWDDGEL